MKVLIWCDGSSGKDGSGGCAAVLRSGGRCKEVALGFPTGQTNQRMEIYAAILGVMTVKRPEVDVIVHSDSAYVVNCFREGWISRWRARGWKTSANRPVANRELWETLNAFVTLFDSCEFVHIRGHSGIRSNERADELAVAARKEAQSLRRTEKVVFNVHEV